MYFYQIYDIFILKLLNLRKAKIKYCYEILIEDFLKCVILNILSSILIPSTHMTAGFYEIYGQ